MVLQVRTARRAQPRGAVAVPQDLRAVPRVHPEVKVSPAPTRVRQARLAQPAVRKVMRLRVHLGQPVSRQTHRAQRVAARKPMRQGNPVVPLEVLAVRRVRAAALQAVQVPVVRRRVQQVRPVQQDRTGERVLAQRDKWVAARRAEARTVSPVPTRTPLDPRTVQRAPRVKWVAPRRKRAVVPPVRVGRRVSVRKVMAVQPVVARRVPRARRALVAATVLGKRVQQALKDSRKVKVGAALQAQRAVPTVAVATLPLKWVVLLGRAAVHKALRDKLEQRALMAVLRGRRVITGLTRRVAARLHPRGAAMAMARPPMAATVSRVLAQTAPPAAIKVMVNPEIKVRL